MPLVPDLVTQNVGVLAVRFVTKGLFVLGDDLSAFSLARPQACPISPFLLL